MAKSSRGSGEIAAALGADLDFATPTHSGERGLNEHTTSLVRQDFPKGTDFRQVTLAQVRAVEERINRRPRKVLGFRTTEILPFFGEVQPSFHHRIRIQ